jgi:hypothetical protein
MPALYRGTVLQLPSSVLAWTILTKGGGMLTDLNGDVDLALSVEVSDIIGGLEGKLIEGQAILMKRNLAKNNRPTIDLNLM